MESIIYPDYDGVVFKYASGTWNSIRNASSGTLNTSTSYNIANSHTSGRGGNTYNIGRYFLEFDTSAINKTISSATLSLYGAILGTLDVILMKSNQSGVVATSDFNEVYGATLHFAASDGNGAGRLAGSGAAVDYSSEITSWTTSGYNDIILSDDAKADIIANDTFNCVLIGYDYDYLDSAPNEAYYRAGFRQDAYSGTSSDPKLVITEQDNSVFFGCNF